MHTDSVEGKSFVYRCVLNRSVLTGTSQAFCDAALRRSLLPHFVVWESPRGWRVLSSYGIAGVRVWIITEADRSVTTMLRPVEY
ncbi:hypothetical protein D3C79_1075210 [compost metagenome]